MILEEYVNNGTWIYRVLLVQEAESDPNSRILVIEFQSGFVAAYPGRAAYFDLIKGGSDFHKLNGMKWPYIANYQIQ